MPISNCKKCGAVFYRTNRPICSVCNQEEEEKYQIAKQWLWDNPGKTINALSKGTGIDRRDILRWIRENRIMMSDVSEFVQCKKCGKRIPAGNFCDHCKLGLAQEVNEGIQALKEESKSLEVEEVKGMHYYPPVEREKRSRL